MRVTFIGPPGSGKGTQSHKLRQATRIAYLATGDLLRQEARKPTERGKELRAIVEANRFAPDEMIIGIVKDALQEASEFILDGVPRTLPQALALDEILHQEEKPLTHALFLDAPDEVIVRRLEKRRMCSDCQATYHPDFNPPQEENLCDRCQQPLVRRSDDTPEKIAKRLEDYRHLTEPLVGHYANLGILHRIDAAPAADEVWEEIKTLLRIV